MIFIDLKKASDTYFYHILLHKMQHYGIDGLEHQRFSSYLDNRRQYCRVNGVTSDTAAISIGAGVISREGLGGGALLAKITVHFGGSAPLEILVLALLFKVY